MKFHRGGSTTPTRRDSRVALLLRCESNKWAGEIPRPGICLLVFAPDCSAQFEAVGLVHHVAFGLSLFAGQAGSGVRCYAWECSRRLLDVGLSIAKGAVNRDGAWRTLTARHRAGHSGSGHCAGRVWCSTPPPVQLRDTLRQTLEHRDGSAYD